MLTLQHTPMILTVATTFWHSRRIKGKEPAKLLKNWDAVPRKVQQILWGQAKARNKVCHLGERPPIERGKRSPDFWSVFAGLVYGTMPKQNSLLQRPETAVNWKVSVQVMKYLLCYELTINGEVEKQGWWRRQSLHWINKGWRNSCNYWR